MSKELLTAKEAADYLNINEKKIYALANARKIPCTKVTGKWLFPRKIIDEWISASARENLDDLPVSRKLDKNIVFHGSNDALIGIMAYGLKKRFPEFSIAVSNVGSISGLVSLNNGVCHVSGVHLFDPETREYNLSCIRKWVRDVDVVSVHLALRRQGLIVAPGNPRNINCVADIVDSGITYVNRQEGSGTRILFDYELKKRGIDPGRVRGYDNEVFTHMDVAMEIFGGYADAGMGIYSAAHVFKLGFVPVVEESYDLVVPKSLFFTGEIQALLSVIRSDDFRKKAERLGGYNLARSGVVVSS